MSLPANLQQISTDPESLHQLTLPELRALWAQCCPKRPPSPLRSLLIIDLACLAQSGGHKLHRETDALIRSAIKATALTRDDQQQKHKARPSAFRSQNDLPAGSKLVREWGGQTHEVTVLATGAWFQYQGQTYKTLTKVAKVITGAHWSGPRFFGLHNCREQSV